VHVEELRRKYGKHLLICTAERLAIDKAYRKMGIATRLMSALNDYARERGYDIVCFYVVGSNYEVVKTVEKKLKIRCENTYFVDVVNVLYYVGLPLRVYWVYLSD
jgi:ribosomal protein S18 acetylase RimI-like enzyme